MNEDIFENICFGDKLETRDGGIVIFSHLYKSPLTHDIYAVVMTPQPLEGCEVIRQATINVKTTEDSPLFIKGKYKESVDVKELDKLAKKGIAEYAGACASSFDTDTTLAMVDGYVDGFKTGYRKAMEE